MTDINSIPDSVTGQYVPFSQVLSWNSFPSLHSSVSPAVKILIQCRCHYMKLLSKDNSTGIFFLLKSSSFCLIIIMMFYSDFYWEIASTSHTYVSEWCACLYVK